MGLVDIPPGESIPEHDETGRDQEEVFVVLSGSPTMVIDGHDHRRPPAPTSGSTPSRGGRSATTATTWPRC